MRRTSYSLLLMLVIVLGRDFVSVPSVEFLHPRVTEFLYRGFFLERLGPRVRQGL